MLEVKTYGKKPLLKRLFSKKEGWIKLGVPVEFDDWNKEY